MANFKTEAVLVAAIDFGTTYSGYAFSLRHDFEKDPTKIMINSTWVAGEKRLASFKTPTCVLLDKRKKFVAFGYEAENKYSTLTADGEDEGYMFFKRFKMSLFENLKLNRGFVITDVSGKHQMPAKVVFAHGIKYLKNHLYETLEKQGSSSLIEDPSYVKWVLTVPAIWDNSAKQFMRESAEEAGIYQGQLKFALEPEAASLYCRVLPLEKLDSSDSISPFKSGDEYMVLDLGGGTVDITVHRVLDDGNLKEVHHASGGAWGGTKVDEGFENLIKDILGAKTISRFHEENTGDAVDMLREFETKKRIITMETESKIQLWMPPSLNAIYEDENDGMSIKDKIKGTSYKGKISWTGDKMRMNPNIIKDLFKGPADNIVKHVNNLLQHPKVKNVSAIIMVGGFSECAIIQEAVKDNFRNRVRVIIPEDAGLAVVKGAVLFGHNPQAITARNAQCTYGIATSRPFKSGIDPEDNSFVTDDANKDKYCRNVFSKHIEINESCTTNEWKKAQEYTPLYANQKSLTIKIFTSHDTNPSYTTDSCCKELGVIKVDLPPGSDCNTVVEVRMMFGDTEFHVEAEHVDKRGQRVKDDATFDFLSIDKLLKS